MNTSPLLSQILVVLGGAGLVIPLFARFRITPVVGFVLVGVLLGPSGLGRWVADYPWLGTITLTSVQGRSGFAQFGMLLLLFSSGLDLSFDRLREMRRDVFGLGALELLANTVLLSCGLLLTGIGFATALVLGLALAMSSTALVLRITNTGKPVGRAALAMLLFEDIALVPVIFILGALTTDGAWLPHIGRGLLALLVLVVLGRMLLPLLFGQAARTKSPELFLAACLLVVIVCGLVTAGSGLSPIVGTLIAGLLIAETEYHAEIESMIAPFKGLALGIFLISVGIGISLDDVWHNFSSYALALCLVLALKALVTAFLLRLMGARAGTASETGILMASPSETTLIVLSAAVSARLLAPDQAQFWQNITAIGLTVTPLLALAGRLVARKMDASAETEDQPAQGHDAIIIGFGRVGRLVADMLVAHKLSYQAIDADADLVADARLAGYRTRFGDAARGDVLERVGLDQARAVILTMDEPHSAQRLVRRLRAQYPALPIIARARDAAHAAQLYQAGASHAVPETLESSLQLSEAVLVDLGVPMGFVIAAIHEKRDLFREQIMADGGLKELPKLKSASLRDRAN